MARYIDKDALLKRWNDVVPRMVRDKDGGIPIDFLVVIHEVSATPTFALDDLRPKGRWVYIQQDDKYVCSECLGDAPTEGDYRQVLTDFCPSCGADMRGGGEDG